MTCMRMRTFTLLRIRLLSPNTYQRGNTKEVPSLLYQHSAILETIVAQGASVLTMFTHSNPYEQKRTIRTRNMNVELKIRAKVM